MYIYILLRWLYTEAHIIFHGSNPMHASPPIQLLYISPDLKSLDRRIEEKRMSVAGEQRKDKKERLHI